MRIIPAIDIRDGKCVRLFQGDFARTTEYSNDPTGVGRRFAELAVGDLHIVDLDGARTGTQQNGDLVASMARSSGLCVQLGGGIRRREDLEFWLQRGIARCVIGSLAIREPEVVREWLAAYGPDRIVLALDVRLDDQGTPRPTTHGWTEDVAESLWDCLDAYHDTGLRHVLCTDVARDGAMQGPNFDLYAEILARYPELQLQASGGVRNIGDLERLRALGVPAAITGRALLDGAISAAEVAAFRQNA